MTKAYDEGWDHWLAGGQRSDNPYRFGTQYWRDWNRGFIDAEWHYTD